MFLFKRFEDLFSKDYWKKSKMQRLRDSIGFFVFWMFILSLVASFLVVISVNRFANESIDEFRRDFVDFEVSMEDGVLSTKGLPEPFVLSEFLSQEDGGAVLGLDDEIVDEFREGFKEGLSNELNVNGQQLEADDLEFILDTKNQLGISVDTVDQTKLGFYFLAEEVIVTDPTAMSEDERVAVESYEGSDDFRFDKEYIISIWDKYSNTVSLIVFAVSFGLYIFMFMLVRFVTAFLWAGIVWLVASMMNFKFDYFEAYGVVMVYMVPITLIEMLISFVFGWIPFTTIGLVVLMAVLHGVAANSDLNSSDKPEVLEGKK